MIAYIVSLVVYICVAYAMLRLITGVKRASPPRASVVLQPVTGSAVADPAEAKRREQELRAAAAEIQRLDAAQEQAAVELLRGFSDPSTPPAPGVKPIQQTS